MPKIDVLANTSSAQRSVRDLSQAFDQVGDSLDDVARNGDTAGTNLERSFKGMVQDAGRAERATKDVARSAKDMGRDINASGKQAEGALEDVRREAERAERAVDDVGDGSKGLGRVKEGAQEVTQEIGQNLGEAVSSVRDNISDLGQVGQDTLGGLAGTLAGAGPAGIVGAAALAAGAVGLGLVTAELQKQQEQADALRDRLSGAYQEAAQAGRNFLDVSQYVAEAQDLMFNADRAEEWKQVQADAKTLGMDIGDVIRANAGDLEQQQRLQERINALMDDAAAKSGTGDGLAKILKSAADSELAIKGLKDVSDRWSDINAVTEENARKTEVANDVVSSYYREAIQQAGVAASATDEFGNKLYELPDGKEIVIEADTGRATDDVSKFKSDVQNIPDKTIAVRADISQATRAIEGLNGQTVYVNVDARGNRVGVPFY
ncbi:hypothetical protein ACF044_05025 [Microbacterium sp. NPDC016588]